MQQHFLKLLDFTPAEIQQLIDTAADLKAKKKAGQAHRYLEGKNVALIFEKSSTRTRCAFEVAALRSGHAHDVPRSHRLPDGQQRVHRRHGPGPGPDV